MPGIVKVAFLIFIAHTAFAQYTISVFAGNGRTDFTGDSGPAATAGLSVSQLASLALDRAGSLYIADGVSRIRKIDSTGTITTFAGGGTKSAAAGLPATGVSIAPTTVAADISGNIYFTRAAFQIDSTGLLHPLANIGNQFTGGMATDAAGNVYLSDYSSRHWVLKVTPAGVVTTVAGTGTAGYSGDNGPATSAQLSGPLGLAVDSVGNIYIADENNNRIRKVDTNGIITTVAGNGKADYIGDGGAATNAALNDPRGVAVDTAGNLYITEYRNSVIRKVNTAGIISTIAGNTKFGESGDGGPALSAQLNGPSGIAVDAAGRIYFGDFGNNRIRMLTPLQVAPAVVSSVVPSTSPFGAAGFTLTVNGSNFTQGATVQWNGAALTTTFASATQLKAAVPPNVIATAGPASVSVLNPSSILSNSVPFVVTPPAAPAASVNYTISVFAGTGRSDFSGDNGPATSAGLTISQLASLALDRAGNLYVADGSSRIRKVDSSGTITTFAGGGTRSAATGLPATAASVTPTTVAADTSGNLYFTRPAFQIDSNGVLQQLANIGNQFTGGVATDAAGNVYLSDYSSRHWVLKVTPAGVVTTVAGTGSAGYSGDNGPAISAQLSGPLGVAVDAAGNVYIVDENNNRVRKVDTKGIITTVAGNGKADYLGDGGAATNASLNDPRGIALDSAGNLYITEYRNSVVRKVDTSGIISTIGGIPGKFGESGDGGPALSAQLNAPTGIAVDPAGRVYVGDVGNYRVRVLTPVNPAPGTTPALITSIAPNSAIAGSAAFTLTVNGSNFASGAVVKWNTATLTTTVPSATQATAAVPASLIAASGAATVTVVNPGTAASNGLPFSINPQGPTGGCTATGLLIQANAPQSGFAAVIGQPVNIQVSIADNCGTPVLTGKGSAVLATFSNNDPSVALNGAGGGKWSGTWVPSSGQGTAIIEITAFEALANGTIVGGKVDISGTISTGGGASLSLTPSALTFSGSQGGPPSTQPLTVVNRGSQAATFTATASVPWLSISPSGGSSAPGAPGIVTVTATPGSLGPGTYNGTVAVQSGGTTLTPVNVTLTVSTAQPILLLSQAALSFRAAQGGGAPLPQDFGILNIGQGVLNWTAQASTLSAGPKWLSVSPGGGTVNRPYLDVSLVNVNADPAGLSAGTYYGQIRVSGSAASNSPQSISVVLTVLPAGTNPGPEVRPTGLIFAGGQIANAPSQAVMIGNPGTNDSTFGSAPVTPPGVGTWFSYTPGTSKVGVGKPVPIDVQPDFSRLSAGATRGAIALLFDDGTIANVALLAVVPPGGTSSSERRGEGSTAGGCTPNQLNIQPSAPPINTTFGQPVTLEVRIVDSCAQPLTPATPGSAVRVGYSNGDPPSTMTHVGNGRWSTTWQPQRSSTSGAYVATITAFQATASGAPFGNQVDIPVTLNGRGDVPIVNSGIYNAASFVPDTLVAPGGLLTIFGNKLTTGDTGVAGTQPFPSELGGTQVLLGDVSLPLLYASDGQINAQAPFDLPVNVPTQLVVRRSGALSVPQTVSVAPAQPAVFTKDQSGSGQGVIVNGVTNEFADASAPVTAGDTVVIYCTGLGAVNPAVAPGTAATSATPTVQPVSVTIGGRNAPVLYAGLTPGFAGLYQINATVPNGVTAGNQVPVVITTSGQTSPPVTIAIR